jgi:hypothetical protein
MHPIASRRFVPTAFVLFVAALTFAGVAAVIALVSTIRALRACLLHQRIRRCPAWGSCVLRCSPHPIAGDVVGYLTQSELLARGCDTPRIPDRDQLLERLIAEFGDQGRPDLAVQTLIRPWERYRGPRRDADYDRNGKRRAVAVAAARKSGGGSRASAAEGDVPLCGIVTAPVTKH